jgi:hypothetical protein
MMKTKKTETGEPQSSAVVVDGKLVLTLPDAMTPVVWQMDLDQAKSAALEVQEDKKKKAFCLMLKDTKGESVEIAPFEEKTQAVRALMMTSQALQDGQGKIRPQAVMQMPYQGFNPEMMAAAGIAHKKDSSNKIGGFLAIALIIILMLVWVLSIPRQGDLPTMGGQSTSASGVSGGSSEAGIPVSADDFLSQQQ